jgi:fibrillarin-like pre-rRNA processing protein
MRERFPPPRGEGPPRASLPGGFSPPFPGLPLARGPPRERPTYWTRSTGEEPSVYGERLRFTPTEVWRLWDPTRSKFAAALCRGLTNLPLRPGSDVLYLGAASGTTASHVADLVAPRGRVFAVEKSLRPFQRLLRVAQRWPNLLPVLGDARRPSEYLPLVPPVDALYVDVAQPGQIDIVQTHAELFLRDGGSLLLALKLSSLGREREAAEHLTLAEQQLERSFTLSPAVPLDPFHRKHAFLVGRLRTPRPRSTVTFA